MKFNGRTKSPAKRTAVKSPVAAKRPTRKDRSNVDTRWTLR